MINIEKINVRYFKVKVKRLGRTLTTNKVAKPVKNKNDSSRWYEHVAVAPPHLRN